MQKVRVIGVPYDLGANIRGSLMGPAAIRIAGLKQKIINLKIDYHDYGDLTIPVRETLEESCAQKKYLDVLSSVNQELFEVVTQSLNDGRIPITLGGDHSLAIGSISASTSYHKKQKKELGLLWIDAHADLNTPKSSPSGNIHGMPLAILLGQGHKSLCAIGGENGKINPKKTVLLGIRDIDGEEKENCKKSGIRYYTMREIDERGIAHVMQEAIEIISNNTQGIHLSCDLDGIDPMHAPGVSTAVTGGLSYREAHLCLEMVADTKKLVSLDIVELNPMTDQNHKTAKLAVELIQSALGKSIV